MSAQSSAGGSTQPARRTPVPDGTRSGRATPAAQRKPLPGGKAAGGHRRGGKTPPPPPRRGPSPRLLAFGSIGTVVLLVVVLVLVKVVGGPGTPAKGLHAPAVTPAQARVLREVDAVTPAEAALVGTPSSVSPPAAVTGQPALKGAGGKPEVLFIGGEFCPYCAAERWSLVMALSRFGTFSGLHETTSSPWDSYPATATFTFYKSSYASKYLDFVPVEYEGNDTTGPETRGILQQLTVDQSALWANYSAKFGVQQGFPFLDIDNRVFVVTPSYVPSVLAGLDQSQIAAKLSNPDDPVTQAVVGTANDITAGICAATGSSASPWCTAPAVTAAAHTMGLS